MRKQKPASEGIEEILKQHRSTVWETWNDNTFKGTVKDLWEKADSEATQAIQRLIQQARKEQVMQDFNDMLVMSEIDEAELIRWRNAAIAQLEQMGGSDVHP